MRTKRVGVVARKRQRPQHPVDQVFGILKLEKPVDALIDEMRGRRPTSKAKRPSRSRRA